MINIKIRLPRKVDIQTILAKDLVSNDFAKEVQKEVIDGAIKPLIAAGTSPVESYEGSRRFTKYKDPKKYPGKGEKQLKPRTPTNLWLTGVMLGWYKAYKVTSNILRMGIPSYAPKEVKDRAEGNNIGTVTDKGLPAIPPRRFIPLKGETYRISVMRKLKNLYAKRIAYLLSSK